MTRRVSQVQKKGDQVLNRISVRSELAEAAVAGQSTARHHRRKTSGQAFLVLSLLWLVGACAGPAPGVRPSVSSASTSLTPTSKGERLTPTSKGERLRDGRLTGRLTIRSGLMRLQQDAPDAQPVADALVRIDGTGLQTRSDREGRFEIQHAPVDEDFALVAEKTDVDGQSFKAGLTSRIPAGSKSLDLVSLLLKTTGSVSGQVLLADQQAAEAVDVYIAGTSLVARTDAQGQYALPDLPEGEYRLTAYKAGYAVQQSPVLSIRAGKITAVPDFKLLPETPVTGSASLRGRITSEGQPLAGAQVALVGQSLLQAPVTVSNENGEYLLTGILPNLSPGMPAETYQLVVTRPFYDPVIRSLRFQSHQTLQQDLELPSQLLTLGRLQVSVSDCAGKPVASALIQLDPSPALGPLPFTDSRGQLQRGQLLPGHYTVYAAKGSQRSFAGVTIDNLATGSDQLPGALARLKLVLGSPCP